MESQLTPTPDWDPIVKQIRKQHKEGPPFINREMLQRVALQLRLYNNGMLNDKPYVLETIRGDVISVEAKPDIESEIFNDWRCNHGDRKKGPYIYYRSIQCMLEHSDMKKFHADIAFLPLVVLFPAKPGRCLGHYHDHKEGDPDKSFFPSELINILNFDRQSWESSIDYAHLKGILRMYAERLVHVDKVIGFGCGNLSRGRTSCNYSTAQHALVFSLQKILSKMHPENAPVRQGFRQARNKEPVELVVEGVFQDPAYTQVEEEVLTSMGMKIAKDPDGFISVNEKSFVVSIDPNTPVQQIIENLARPIAIIQMSHVDEFNGAQVGSATDPSSERVDKMLRNEYELMKLTTPKELRNICLYVRK